MILILQRAALAVGAMVSAGEVNLMRWDGLWYRMVATSGYVYPPTTDPLGHPSALSDLAFFPLYPSLAALIGQLPGLSVDGALLGIAWLCTLAAGWGIFAVGQALGDRRVGTLLVILWGAAPRSLVLVLPYSEPLFTALVAWCMYLVIQRRWVPAALLCAAAGLTRAAVLPLVLALAVEAVLSATAGRRLVDGRSGWAGLAGVAAAGLAGFGLFVLFVAVQTRQVLGYFDVQRAWGTTMAMPWRSVTYYLAERAGEMGGFVYGDYIAIVVAVYGVLVCSMVLGRERAVPTVYAAGMWLWMMCAQGFFHAKARFMLPAFTAWLPLARWLSRRPLWIAVLVVSVGTALGVAADVTVLAGPWSP